MCRPAAQAPRRPDWCRPARDDHFAVASKLRFIILDELMLKLDVFLLHDVLPLAKAAVLKRRQITVRAQMRFSIQESATSREARSATLTEFEVASMAIVENMNPAFEFLLVKCRLAEIWDVNLEAN